MIKETDIVVPVVIFFAASDPFPFSTSLPLSTSTTTPRRLPLMGVSFLCFSAIIGLWLVFAKNHTRSKKAVVVRRTSLELPDADVPLELKEEGLYEIFSPPAEVQENAWYEMYALPGEMTGDTRWPELEG